MIMSTDRLLSEFPSVSTQQWERLIREDLKGADDGKKLNWCPEEGLVLKPYYRAEDLTGLRHLAAKPDHSPEACDACSASAWRIREDICASDPKEANRQARAAVAAGTEEIAFREPTVRGASDLDLLFAHLDRVPVHFERVDRFALQLLAECLRRPGREAAVSTGFDPFADLDLCAEIVASRPPVLVPFEIHAGQFQEQGATAVEEVGFTLAAAVDFIAAMEERTACIDRIVDSLGFSFAIGPDFFIQIAKFRAFRLVFAQAVASFGALSKSARTHIHARSPRWNRTIYDPHTNILRATTEVISAAFGGADSISVAPFDESFREPDELSRRLARNTQIILKQEAFLAQVADPGGGSYCLEAITDLIARQAWELMRKIESEGGYQSPAAKAFIAAELSQRAQERERAIACRKRVLTGTNRFADASEKALDRILCADPDGAAQDTHAFERLRLQTERHALRAGRMPRILLAEFGEDRKTCTSRSQFVADFLACAGFVSDVAQFHNASEIAASGFDLIVLCSSDADSLTIASSLMAELNALRKATPVLVAGHPETADRLKAAGIAEFIHLRSNAVEVLARVGHLLGIEDQ